MPSNARWLRDLFVVIGVTVVGAAVVLVDPRPSPIRTVLVAPLVLFVPGYALVAVLYPERYRPGDDRRRDADRIVAPPRSAGDGVPPSARIALSVASSVALVPAVALVVALLGAGIRVRPLLVALVGMTVLLVGLAVGRRRAVPEDHRFSAPALLPVVRAGGRYFRTHEPNYSPTSAYRATSHRGVLLNVAVVAAVLVFVASVGFAAVAGTGESGFTEMYLVTQTDNGSFVARDYPQRFDGSQEPLYVTVENHEGGERTYTVLVELQRVDRTPNGTTVVEERRIDRFSRQVGDGETVHVAHRPSLSRSGPSYRLRYLLYVGDPPSDPSTDDAYRSVHLWLGGGGTGGTGTGSEGTNGTGGGGTGGTA